MRLTQNMCVVLAFYFSLACSIVYAADTPSTAEQVTDKADRLFPSKSREFERLWPNRFKPIFPKQVKSIIPLQTGRVVDRANLLNQSELKELEQIIQALNENNTVDMAILTVNKIHGMSIESFSLRVAKAWRLGQWPTTGTYFGKHVRNNGLLITYAVGEDLYRIEVGKGLEHLITNSLAADIIRNHLRTKADPKNGKRDFFGAFRNGIRRVEVLSEKNYFSVYSMGPDEIIINTVAMYILITLVIAIILSFYRGIDLLFALGRSAVFILVAIFSLIWGALLIGGSISLALNFSSHTFVENIGFILAMLIPMFAASLGGYVAVNVLMHGFDDNGNGLGSSGGGTSFGGGGGDSGGGGGFGGGGATG